MEKFFYLIKHEDWLTYANTAHYRLPPFSEKGFIELLTPEQVVPAAQNRITEQAEFRLLKIEMSTADPLLKWANEPGQDASQPRYYGELPRTLVKKVYDFKPDKDGKFALSTDPFLKGLLIRTIPKATIDKFLYYQDWQKTAPLYGLQTANFARPNVQLQWWYFDFFLRDGSSVVLAFIPQHWWDKPGPTTEKTALFTIALTTKQGVVKRFLIDIPPSDLKASADRLEIPSQLLIQSIGAGPDRTYSIRVNFPEITGVFDIRPTRPPFAAFPTGVMPGLLKTVMTGAPLGGPSFCYVSQVPNSTVSGSLTWEDEQTSLEGQAYHEQGRLDDTPDRQGGSWTWYHFSGEGWNIFGSPGSYIYLQHGDRMLRSGFQLIASQYTLQQRTFSSPDHPKILTGGEVHFCHDDLSFRLKLSPATTKTLVCYPSPDPNQIWGTAGGPATLSITEGSTTRTIEGRMFLETCSWESSKSYP